MRRALLIAALLSLALCGGAAAATGAGRYISSGKNPLEPNAPALSTFGDDVIRVRAYPSLSGGTWMVELHSLANGNAEGEAIFFERTRVNEKWSRSGSTHLRLDRDEWALMIAKVDALLAEGQSPAPAEKPPVGLIGYVCVTADGISHEIERRRADRDTWMTSQSGDDRCGGRDPSEAVAQLIFTTAASSVCRAMSGSAPCDPEARPPNDALTRYRNAFPTRP